jgi:hypothetical protein
VASFALFLALTGGSYAAITLKRNQVRKQHLAKSSVTSRAVANGALLRKDFKRGQLPGTPGGPAVDGAPGPPGPPGTNGADGQDGAALVASVVETQDFQVANAAALTKMPVEISWTQRAGAVDQLQGAMRLTMADSCTGTAFFFQARETTSNREISFDSFGAAGSAGNGSPDSNGTAIAGVPADGTFGNIDWVPLPIELATFAPPAVDTARKVEFYGERDCAANPTVLDFEAYVTRFVP